MSTILVYQRQRPAETMKIIKYDDGKDCLCSALAINCFQFGCFMQNRYVLLGFDHNLQPYAEINEMQYNLIYDFINMPKVPAAYVTTKTMIG